MLQSFGDKVKGSKVLGYLIIGIISVPFALFGIQSYLGGNGQAVAAKVNDVEISVQTLDREAQRQRQALAENFGGKIPDAFNSPELFKNQALDSLVKKEILTQYLNQYHFAISNEDLSAKILADQTFMKDGKFDNKFYEAQVSSLGYSVSAFEGLIREYARLSQIQDGIISSSFILKNEDKVIKKLQNQKRQLSIYKFKNKDFEETVKINNNEISDFFEKNKSQYQHAEKVKVAYIELTLDQIAKDIIVSDEELRSQYDSNKALYKSKEKRKASHILIKAKASDTETDKEAAKNKILALKKEISDGAKFSEVAKKNSQDIGSKNSGGDLGLVERGFMVKPFEDALYALKEGELSDPVLTGFGYHLIYLEEIQTPTIQAFSKVKRALEKDLKLKKADSTFYDLSEKIANFSYENPDNLEAASEESGIKIKITKWLNKGSIEGIAAIRKVSNAIFSQQVLSDRQNSELLEIQDNHVMVLRIAEYQAAKPKTLTEVTAQIEATLKNINLTKVLIQKANNLIADLKDNNAIKVKKESKGLVGRNSVEIDSGLLTELFRLRMVEGKQIVSEPIVVTDGVAVITSNKVENPEITETPVDITTQVSMGSQEYSNWINALKDKSEVSIFKNAIE